MIKLCHPVSPFTISNKYVISKDRIKMKVSIQSTSSASVCFVATSCCERPAQPRGTVRALCSLATPFQPQINQSNFHKSVPRPAVENVAGGTVIPEADMHEQIGYGRKKMPPPPAASRRSATWQGHAQVSSWQAEARLPPVRWVGLLQA